MVGVIVKAMLVNCHDATFVPSIYVAHGNAINYVVFNIDHVFLILLNIYNIYIKTVISFIYIYIYLYTES